MKEKNNMLGIISDMAYKRKGILDKQAGVKLYEKVKKDDKYMPLLLQSSDAENAKLAKKLKVGFINKNSKTLSIELRNFIREYFAFGMNLIIEFWCLALVSSLAPKKKNFRAQSLQFP